MLTHRDAITHFDCGGKKGVHSRSLQGLRTWAGKKNKDRREKKGAAFPSLQRLYEGVHAKGEKKIKADAVKVIKYDEMTQELMLIAGGSNFTFLHFFCI